MKRDSVNDCDFLKFLISVTDGQFCYRVPSPEDTGSWYIMIHFNYDAISEHFLRFAKLQFFLNLDCFRLQVKTGGRDLLLSGVLKELPTQLLPQAHISKWRLNQTVFEKLCNYKWNILH
jgi:hypothetical protein